MMRTYQSFLNSVIAYFDLFSNYRKTIAVAHASDKPKPSLVWELALFVSLALGIITKGVLDYLTEKAAMPFDSWHRLIALLVTAIIAFPAAFKGAMEMAGPSFVQCCVVFTTGLGVRTT